MWTQSVNGRNGIVWGESESSVIKKENSPSHQNLTLARVDDLNGYNDKNITFDFSKSVVVMDEIQM
ncbi:MAG: hypothetical protein OCD02_07515 [Spirochaetaceae bacterium]